MPARKTPSDGGSIVDSGPPPEALLDAALRLLAARARSERELRDRLLKKGFASLEVSHCMRWLLDRGLLDDEAFARALTRDRLRFSPRSPFLLRKEAALKGVNASLAGEVVDAVLEEEGVSAEDLSAMAAEGWVRKQGSGTRRDLLAKRFDPKGEKARRRLYGFLARRGFAGDAAQRGLEAGEEKARELEGDPGEPNP